MKKKNSELNEQESEKRTQPHYGAGPYGDSLYYGQPAYDGDVDEGGIDLIRLIQIGLRRWKTVLLVVLLSVGLGALYLQLATPIYRANALMEMSVRKPRLVKESAVIEDQSRGDTDMIFNTRITKFKSQSMLERVANEYIKTHYNNTNTVAQLTKLLENTTEWSVQRKSFVVEVSVTSPSPLFAKTIANLYAESATKMMIEENRTSSDNAVSWLQQQAEQQKKALAFAEQAIIDYRKTASLDTLRSQKLVGEETLVKLNNTLVDLESKLITDRALLTYLKKIQENPGAAESIPAGVVNAEQLQEFINAWWDAKLEYAKLFERYTEAHPLVKESNAKVAQQQNRLDQYLKTITQSISNGIDLLGKQTADITTRIEQENQTVLDLELQIVQAEGRINTLSREHEAADTTYRSVLSRIEESRMAADETTAVLKELQPASLPSKPISPNKLKIIALALLLGGMCGYGLAFLMELMEDKIYGVKDIEKLGLDMLALVPHQKVTDRSKLATICLADKFSHFTETFASLRVILTYKEAKERFRVLLVTSTQPEEGKTVTACNLAISMAQGGRKTLLIDLDLRRPRLRAIFDPDKKATSLLHTLEKGATDSFNKLPIKGGTDNLDVIISTASGKISPAEIIAGEGTAALMAWARDNYECVIIDSPPMGVVADAQCIADYVDGVILAVRPEVTRRRALRHCVERMAAVNTIVNGVVLNNVKIRKHFTYSTSYHHYNSYHSYGTYEADAAEVES